MRDIFFFRHYMTELEIPSIAAFYKKHGVKGYGFYWHLMERLYAERSHMLLFSKDLVSSLASSTKMSRSKVKMLLNDMEALKLICYKDDLIYSERVENEIKEVINSRKRRNRLKNAS